MPNRCLIRSLFILPVLLCLAAWGWTGWYEAALDYMNGAGWITLDTAHGAVTLKRQMSVSSDGYNAAVFRTPSVRFWPEADADDLCFLGFRWVHESIVYGDGTAHPYYSLTIPYWFPLLVFSLLLLGAWRKTRHRPDPATAFPVVLKTKGRQ